MRASRAGAAAVRTIRPSDLSQYLPTHWHVTRMWQKGDGSVVSDIMKIHCRTDKKTFVSDFEAHLKNDGEIETLYINGKKAGRNMLCE